MPVKFSYRVREAKCHTLRHARSRVNTLKIATASVTSRAVFALIGALLVPRRNGQRRWQCRFDGVSALRTVSKGVIAR